MSVGITNHTNRFGIDSTFMLPFNICSSTQRNFIISLNTQTIYTLSHFINPSSTHVVICLSLVKFPEVSSCFQQDRNEGELCVTELWIDCNNTDPIPSCHCGTSHEAYVRTNIISKYNQSHLYCNKQRNISENHTRMFHWQPQESPEPKIPCRWWETRPLCNSRCS